MAQTKKEQLLSDLGLSMHGTMERIKNHKNNHQLKQKVTEMNQTVLPAKNQQILNSYESGIKHAEDMAASNEDFHEEHHKGKAKEILKRIRIGWAHPKHTAKNALPLGRRRDFVHDDMFENEVHHHHGDSDEGLTQINSNSPELQDFGG